MSMLKNNELYSCVAENKLPNQKKEKHFFYLHKTETKHSITAMIKKLPFVFITSDKETRYTPLWTGDHEHNLTHHEHTYILNTTNINQVLLPETSFITQDKFYYPLTCPPCCPGMGSHSIRSNLHELTIFF